MKTKIALLLVGLMAWASVSAAMLETKPDDPTFERFLLLRAPQATKLVLRKGDRLAICGDSITEQRMYSRIMEDYLTMCVPELGVTVRQYGWSGERAPGFLGRMTNDCLRFEPTIATTCYGMNDHEYKPYEERIGLAYRTSSRRIIEAFQSQDVRVIQGAPGCVGKMPHWVKEAAGTVDDLNLSLCNLRNIGIYLAKEEKAGFADVFWPMLKAGVVGKQQYGTNYAIAGGDGVHPGWAGHLVMAYSFLKAMGLDGEIGVYTVDLSRNTMRVSKGHEVESREEGEYKVSSSRYPFCYCAPAGVGAAAYPVCGADDPKSHDSIRSALSLVPFEKELNRLTLVGRNGKAKSYLVTWGGQTKAFSAGELAEGINLAAEFPVNPFCEAFARVDAAVAAKQAFETKQVKEVFHGDEGKANMEAAVVRTEGERARLEAGIRGAFRPVTHIVRVVPETN